MVAVKRAQKSAGAVLDTAKKQQHVPSTESSSSSAIQELSFYEPQYKEGYLRPFFLSFAKPFHTSFTPKELAYLAVLVLVSIYVRLYKLDVPAGPTDQEVRLVKAINNYINNQFFIDLYPPLSKLLLTVIAVLFGYDGSSFAPLVSEPFPLSFPYLVLRFITALQGIASVLSTFVVLKLGGCQPITSVAASLLLAFDSGNIVIGKFFSADAYLIATLAFVTLLYTKLNQLPLHSKQWFKMFYLLSLSLGVGVSTKYSGVLTIAWILLLSLKKAWLIIGDLSIETDKKPASRLRYLVKYLVSVFVFVVFIPSAIFFSLNVLNLRLLSKINNLGDDQGFSLMSSAFQANLVGNDFGVTRKSQNSSIPLNLLYGSRITIRHYDSLGGYLHSHDQRYKTGSHEQQVTLYNYKDENNYWVVEYKHRVPEEELYGKKKFVSEGGYIRLRHAVTGKYLHVNELRGPVSEQEYDYEVSGKARDEDKGDLSDTWQVWSVLKYSHNRIANDPGDSIIHPVGTVFRLYNRGVKCHLLSHDITLPEWGFNQQEVICVKEASKIRSVFYVESSYHPLLQKNPELEKVEIRKLSMWSKFREYLQAVAKFSGNYELYLGKPPLDTDPGKWLLSDNQYLVSGQTRAGDWKSMPVYFRTNLLVQYVGTGLVALFVLYHAFLVVSNLKWYGKLFLSTENMKQYSSETSASDAKWKLSLLKFNSHVFDLALGWAVHYFPLWLLDRLFSSYNYLPAYYFLILVIGHAFELAVQRSAVGYGLMAVLVSSAVSNYMSNRDTIYGFSH